MDGVEKIDSLDSMVVRYCKLILGLFLNAVGIVMTINANLGYSPWDVFHQGLSNILHIKIGTANIMVGITIITIGIMKGRRPGIGTICNMFLIGAFMNLIMGLNIIPIFSNLYIRIISIFVGMAIMAVGTYFYIRAGFGPGPRDGLMLLFHERTGKSIRLVRGSVETTALIAGYILGGPVGIGTVILSLGIGYIIQFVFAIFHFDPKTVDHRGWDDEVEFVKELLRQIV